MNVDIYFTAAGIVRLPDKPEIWKMTEQMRSIPQPLKQLIA